MGTWGYYSYPTEPPIPPDRPDEGWWEEMAEVESMREFVEREMSYEEAMAEDIASDEGGWGGRDFEG